MGHDPDGADEQPPRLAELSRRDVLEGLGALAASSVLAPGCGSGAESSGGSGDGGGMAGDGGMSCVLTPEQVQGPFFIESAARSDITEGKPGQRLRLALTIIETPSCTPIEGAIVELWHTDAAGAYSGFDRVQGNTADTAGETFLRGHQVTDALGAVVFETIYPGWYPGRTPHLHLLALLDANRLITTQLYFDDALTDRVYQLAPYAARGLRDTTNAEDNVSRFGGAPGTAPLQIELVENGDGYSGSFVIGVAPS